MHPHTKEIKDFLTLEKGFYKHPSPESIFGKDEYHWMDAHNQIIFLTRRLSNGHVQYATLSLYEGEFCEGILEEYACEKNTRAKLNWNVPLKSVPSVREKGEKIGFIPLKILVFRNLQQLEEKFHSFA